MSWTQLCPVTSGEYRPEHGLFEKLKDIGIEVEDHLQYYSYFAVYEAETYQSQHLQ